MTCFIVMLVAIRMDVEYALRHLRGDAVHTAEYPLSRARTEVLEHPTTMMGQRPLERFLLEGRPTSAWSPWERVPVTSDGSCGLHSLRNGHLGAKVSKTIASVPGRDGHY